MTASNLHVLSITLALDGYPRKYFCGQRKTTDRSLPVRNQGVSDKIQRVLSEVEVKVAMKPHLTIKKTSSLTERPFR